MTAKIQLARGIDEVVSDVKLTRSKDGSTSTATFIINKPECTSEENNGNVDITGLFMIDEEGELVTRNVNAKFVNGKPAGIEAVYKMEGESEWERFMRFMDRYAEANEMGFNKK
jgi:photosystem II 13kDa protein